jgi:Rv2632c-like
MFEPQVWTVDIAFTEGEDDTRADAVLEVGATRYHGWGRARRNPADPDRPKIGAEIAAARALENLVVQLRGAAEHDIEDFEGHPVRVHV